MKPQLPHSIAISITAYRSSGRGMGVMGRRAAIRRRGARDKSPEDGRIEGMKATLLRRSLIATSAESLVRLEPTLPGYLGDGSQGGFGETASGDVALARS